MQVIDVNEFRDPAIAYHGLTGVDEAYTFYYDETNNPRRFHVENTGFNAQPMCFVLGGLCHRGRPRPLGLAELRRAVRLQPNAPELKLRHLGTGDFLRLIGSPKVERYLDWLAAEDLLLHYLALDPLYWSVIDIVDSIISHPETSALQVFHGALKSDLCEILAADPADLADLFGRFSYPDVGLDRRGAFIRELQERLEAREKLISQFGYQMLRGVLQAGARVDQLLYLQDETPHELIDSFEHFFRDRLCLFKHSHHVFDVEPVIEERLRRYEFRDGERELGHFRFVDSKEEAGVQASDPIVGLLGKLFSYSARVSRDDFAADLRSLSTAQKRTLGKLCAAMDRSIDATPALVQRVMSARAASRCAMLLGETPT